ncbi:hypothetical protein EUGRSUZ_D01881 [Eucalyptus grandis]|uniref:Uncharacterized protein n=2 Tax=Eucalyptus grandis TaxID=71139 RepID=A0ACC3L6F3_EUCGR|nr:hypothetical protein EUGRSUZ_D01881 [Eucalyptus grandis]
MKRKTFVAAYLSNNVTKSGFGQKVLLFNSGLRSTIRDISQKGSCGSFLYHIFQGLQHLPWTDVPIIAVN